MGRERGRDCFTYHENADASEVGCSSCLRAHGNITLLIRKEAENTIYSQRSRGLGSQRGMI